MADTATIFFAGLAVAISLVTLYIAYSIYGVYKSTVRGWLPITIAVFLMAILRVFSFLSEMDQADFSYLTSRLIVQFLSAAITVLFAYGFWQMKKGLDENERVERETMARMHEFEIKHRRHEEIRQKKEKAKKR